MSNVRRNKGIDFEIIGHIATFINEYGYSPSVRDLCDLLGYSSTSTMHSHLKRLSERGLIIYEPTKPRTIRLTGNVHVNFGR